MAQESPSRDQDKFMVRMPEGMRERIAEAAKDGNRSMNAEIVARLELSFERPGSLSMLLEARVAELERLEDQAAVIADQIKDFYSEAKSLAESGEKDMLKVVNAHLAYLYQQQETLGRLMELVSESFSHLMKAGKEIGIINDAFEKPDTPNEVK